MLGVPALLVKTALPLVETIPSSRFTLGFIPTIMMESQWKINEVIYVVYLIIVFNQYIYTFNLQLLPAHNFICLEHPVSRDINGAQLIYKV